jgi:hypothetical protein
MKRPAIVFGAIAVAISAAIVVAQAPTNFAGRWTADRPAAPAPGGGGDDDDGGGRGGRGRGGFSGVNQDTTITQDAKTMTVAYPQGPNSVTLTFNFDGTETKNTVPTNFAPETQTSKVAWQGDKLVITTTTASGTQQTRTLSLVGGKLLVETTMPGAGGKPVISRATYTKAPDAPAGRGGRGGRGDGAAREGGGANQ